MNLLMNVIADMRNNAYKWVIIGILLLAYANVWSQEDVKIKAKFFQNRN